MHQRWAAAPKSFWSEKEFNDSSRFPARIWTAAKALFTQGCYGEFKIYHGHLTGGANLRGGFD